MQHWLTEELSSKSTMRIFSSIKRAVKWYFLTTAKFYEEVAENYSNIIVGK